VSEDLERLEAAEEDLREQLRKQEASAGDGSASSPSPSEAAPPRAGIAYNDRTLVLGYTGSGKSELLNHHFSASRCQKLLIDAKDEFAIAEVVPARAPDELDWSEPVLHYIPSTGDADEWEELFAACFRRRWLVVCVHELGDLCEFQPGRTPRHVRKYLSMGRSHGLGLLGGSQRPVEMPKRARTEVQHVFVFVPELDPDDHNVIAQICQLQPPALSQMLAELQRDHGHYSFLWFNKRTREVNVSGPLPDHVRSQTIVGRRTVA
jgi:hypothetical protein